MHASELLKDLFRQMEWADGLVWRTVLSTPSPAGDASIRNRLHHVHLVQRAFLHIWRGEPMDFDGTEHLAGVDLARWGRAYHASARTFVEPITDKRLDSLVHLPWASRATERLGINVTDPRLGDTLMQVASHSTYHRGQVNARIRELRSEPPVADYIAWVWMGRPAASWPRGTEDAG